jgi:translocation and assembly module TamB
LLGTAEAVHGTVLFRETRFNLMSGTVHFESATQIAPRFNITGQARVREQKSTRIQIANAETADRPQEYEVNLLVFGTPSDYKIRLSSSPSLAEQDIISLLVLGVTSHGDEGNYADLGSALVGQIPLQSKLQNEFGLDIRLKSSTPSELQQLYQAQSAASQSTSSSFITVPSVQIQKEITKKTKLSFSNTIEANPSRELKLEQMLDDNLSVNATVQSYSLDPSLSPSQSYGLDFRYRFNFE